MLKLKIGGMLGDAANSEAACKIVPSPPSVEVRSTLSGNAEVAVPESRSEEVNMGNGR
jgi:hypothetical protein